MEYHLRWSQFRRLRWALGLLSVTWAWAQANRQELYLITGSLAPPYASQVYPAHLYRFDKLKQALQSIRALTSTASVFNVDHDRRIAVLGLERRLWVVNMDSPRTDESFVFNYGNRHVLTHFILELPAGRLIFAVDVSPEHPPPGHIWMTDPVTGRTIDSSNPSRRYDVSEKLFLGVDLRPAGNGPRTQEVLPWEFYKYVRLGGVEWRGRSWLHCRTQPDGSLGVWTPRGQVLLDYRPPKSVPKEEKQFVIEINNDAIVLLKRVETRVSPPAGLGHTVCEIYDKRAGEWHSLRLPGGGSATRGFGYWVTTTVLDKNDGSRESPGRSQRRQKDTKTGHPIDWDFRDMRLYSPGLLFLYDSRARKEYTIETKQGDSEVLLVEGDAVYYRVNRAIYKATLGPARVENPIRLVEDEVVQDIHWAFLGPN